MKLEPVMLALSVACAGAAALADTVVLPAARDNTLIQVEDGSRSIGAGPHFFAGRILIDEIALRRGLVAFDLTGHIPPGSTITGVDLTLHMSMTVSGPHDVALHRALADWGEGASSYFGGIGAPSEPGDATWLHTFYDDRFWSAPGGDFAALPSASTSVDQAGFYTWGSAPELVADVQDWLDDPARNFGWVLVGDEEVRKSAKRFDTRENPDETLRPALRVEFLPPCDPAPAGAGHWNRQCLEGEPLSPTEPGFAAAVVCVEDRLDDLGLFDVGACDGIDADPRNNACEQALRKLTSLLFNLCTDRLQSSCPVRGGWPLCESETIGELGRELAAMIRSGRCRRAASCTP